MPGGEYLLPEPSAGKLGFLRNLEKSLFYRTQTKSGSEFAITDACMLDA